MNPPVAFSQIVSDTSHALSNKVDPLVLQKILKDIPLFTTVVTAANGSVASFVFYNQFSLTCANKTFNAKGGPLNIAGSAALFGSVYTNNLVSLMSNAVTFEYNCSPKYTTILFFDKNTALLGHFQSLSVSNALSVGGGTGVWA
jgi:hypothetical protein